MGPGVSSAWGGSWGNAWGNAWGQRRLLESDPRYVATRLASRFTAVLHRDRASVGVARDHAATAHRDRTTSATTRDFEADK